MKKITKIVSILWIVVILSGCETIFNNAIENMLENVEIDHFEVLKGEPIELVVGSDDEPDYKSYVNRVTKEGNIREKDTFHVFTEELDVNTVGEYTITYSFMSLESSVHHDHTVFVIQRPKEEVIELDSYEKTSSSLTLHFIFVESDYEIEVDRVEIYTESDNVLVERELMLEDFSTVEFMGLSSVTAYSIEVHFSDNSVYTFEDVSTSE